MLICVSTNWLCQQQHCGLTTNWRELKRRQCEIERLCGHDDLANHSGVFNYSIIISIKVV